MKNEQVIDSVTIEYKNDPYAQERFISFIVDYLLDHYQPDRDGEDGSIT